MAHYVNFYFTLQKNNLIAFVASSVTDQSKLGNNVVAEPNS